jgi:hypothetical protein
VLRFFAALSFFTLSLMACQGGFDACIAKTKATCTFEGQTLEIPLSATQSLVYTPTPPKSGKILKYDPFLSLYLVTKNVRSKYYFTLNKHLSLGEASVTPKMAIEGKITRAQIGLNSLAKANEAFFAPSLLLNSCCFLEGIVTPRGIIQKPYIKRFIESKESRYGDIGIRLDIKSSLPHIVACDPFYKENPFEKGDILLEFEGKKIASASEAAEKILFAPIGSKQRIKVQRGSQILTFEVVVAQRFGGGVLSDTFLESKGIFLDDALRVVEVNKERLGSALAPDDRILGVDGTIVRTQQELRESLGKEQEGVNLLVERAGFQFFVRIN